MTGFEPAPELSPAETPAEQTAAHEQALRERFAHVEEERESLYGALHHRFLSLWHAGPRLRLLTTLAIAAMTVATIAAFFVDAPMPRQPINTQGADLVVIGTPILALCLALFSIAWAYMLTAVAHARWPVHLLGLIAFTGLFSEGATTWLDVRPLFAYAMFGLVGLAWVASWSRRLIRRDRGLGLVLPLIFFVIFAAYYALGWAASIATGSAVLFGFEISLQMSLLVFFLIPIVFLSGSDFAEWGDVAGDWLRRQTDRIRGRERIALSGVAVLVAAGLLARAAIDYGKSAIPELLVALAVTGAVVLFTLVTRLLHHSFPVRIPIPALLIAAFVYMATFVGSYLALGLQAKVAPTPSSGSFNLTEYSRSEDPQFHLFVPSLWEQKISAHGGGGWFSWVGASSADPGQFSVVVVKGDWTGKDAFSDWVAACCTGQSTVDSPPVDEGDWARRRVDLNLPDGSHLLGSAWQRQHDGNLYLLYGLSAGSWTSLNDPLFNDLVKSFEFGPAPPVAAVDGSASIRAIETVGAIPWALVIVATAFLLGLRRRVRPGVAVGLLFLSAVGIFYIGDQIDNMATFVGLPTGHWPLQLVGLRLQGVEMAAAIVTIALVAYLAVRHRLQRGMDLVAFLLVLDVSLVMVDLLFWIFSAKQQLESVLIAQTVLVTLALTWDVVMSGGSIAQGHGRWFPRQSRVLLYFGYLILVAAAVLFFSGFLAQTGGRVPNDTLPTDFWAQSGLVSLGLPMLVLLLLLKLGRRARASRRAGPEGPSPPPKPGG